MKNYAPDITQRFLLIRDEVVKGGVITQNEFAKSIGEYPQNFALMEKGTRSPTLDQICRVCETYNYNPTWLLLGIGNKNLDKKTEVTIEQRVSDLEMQVRSLKKAIKSGSKATA